MIVFVIVVLENIHNLLPEEGVGGGGGGGGVVFAVGANFQ